MIKMTNAELEQIAVMIRDSIGYEEVVEMIGEITKNVMKESPEAVDGSPLDKIGYIAREMYGRGALTAAALLNEVLFEDEKSA